MIEQLEIIDVKPLDDLEQIIVTFNTNEKRLLNIKDLKGSVFEALKDENIFKSAKVTSGFISWDNGSIDCAPEYIYENGYDYKDINQESKKSFIQELVEINVKRNEASQVMLMCMDNLPINKAYEYVFALDYSEVKAIYDKTQKECNITQHNKSSHTTNLFNQ